MKPKENRLNEKPKMFIHSFGRLKCDFNQNCDWKHTLNLIYLFVHNNSSQKHLITILSINILNIVCVSRVTKHIRINKSSSFCHQIFISTKKV